MPRTCKNGQECRKYKAYENVDDKHVSIIQPILLVGMIFVFYIFYFRLFKRRYTSNESYRRKMNKKNISSKPVISLCLNDIVIKIIGNNAHIMENSVEPLNKLSSISELFVIAQISNDVQEKNIIDLFKKLGLFDKGLKEHRLMFCNTSNGRASMIRQLSPLTHVDNDETVIKTLTGKIPNLVQIYENINTSDHSNFFTSLQAFTQVICAVATVEGIN
ncbi:hypothetical protein PFAG_03605 [Plasmodium falciparum Santa Lucia]|uniref:Peroxisome assembly protein 22, putative n=14 Tax=Plasmodium falciparum TaxID=5833 RepID=Q8IHP2_PLAF7|nr:peroxisome assembly protein 22, putative [Plasmodium falciparum 3D7]ETW15203.1 hypothetical protein PFFVO_05497 [Plasmodium falciparum Vietnam Oak-Knoll (FVO)]ETW30300.1 hypothetical protein PFFCH_02316 [Plasmodium falciparum FCH/4]ETW35685.1 hypothetical protein PFTANZ_03608 [Plasmodium falciparum Tanzania (2000708)]ETW41879.1 hypothetical protein PFNF135_03769 [Plasmodium falciparum NF135/5.C10]ETW47042.1 hypothetical protein PFMALIP_05030 [Plasmodium falciparum MaliPS096_E11]ETW54907.1 |eukprot:XP_001348154.1 conserved Plasmodium protein, unknown function [Plasmodium falciparum 3D7]